MENNVTVNVYTQNKSYFDGGLLSYIGHSLLSAPLVYALLGDFASWLIGKLSIQ